MIFIGVVKYCLYDILILVVVCVDVVFYVVKYVGCNMVKMEDDLLDVVGMENVV